jgi:hypothetical protein
MAYVDENIGISPEMNIPVKALRPILAFRTNDGYISS